MIKLDMERWLAETTELVTVKRAVEREEIIRQAIADTGETREVVVSMLGAMDSMAEEAVLSLCEGEPTTLLDALTRYRDALANDDGPFPLSLVDDLTALINHTWPGEPERPVSTRVLCSDESGCTGHCVGLDHCPSAL